MTRLLKKASALAVIGVAAALALSGCGTTTPPAGGSSSASATPTSNRPAEETGPVTLKFVWWGNDTRNQLTKQVLDLFTAKYPNIKVETETADFASYWTKVAAMIAAGQMPDVMQMDAAYVQQYVADENLMDLESIGIDLSKFNQGSIDAGRVNGTLYAATFGQNVAVVAANPAVFAKAGVPLPDDSKWTWDDLANIAKQIGAKGGSDYYGSIVLGVQDASMTGWIRQHGEVQWKPDGSIGYTAPTVEAMMKYWSDLMAAGGTPPATVQVQDDQAAFDQSLCATGRAALCQYWSNQVVALDKATGQDIKLLRFPTMTGNAKDAKMWLKSSMYLSIAAGTKHPDAALKLVEFLENDIEANKILGTERGIPANSEVLAAITPAMNASNQKVVNFMNLVKPDLGPANGLPGPGGNQSQTIQFKYMEAALLGNMTPADASAGFMADLKKAMAG